MPRSLPSKLVIAFSSLLLAHACYSAHEHSSLPIQHLTPSSPSSSSTSSSSSASTSPNLPGTAGSSLPLDITLETLFSLALLLVGIVSDGWELKPISLRKYAGGLENGSLVLDPAAAADGAGKGKVKGRGRGLYDVLEERPGFLDVRKQRKEFSDWVKEGELKSAMDG